MLISLLLLSISCQTRPATVEPVSVEINFPVFPNPAGNVTLHPDGTVSMPLEYWLKIAEYKLEVDTAESLYQAVK